jgi:hypothetical protein
MKKKLINIVLFCSCVLLVCVVFGAAIMILRNVNVSEQTMSTFTAETEVTTKRTLPQTEAVTDVLEPAAAATLIPALTTAPAQPEPEPVTSRQKAADTPIRERDPERDMSGKIEIELWSFTEEVALMFDRYLERYPERAENITLNVQIIPTTDELYEPALDQQLAAGTPDIYVIESAFIDKYTRGNMAEYAATYKDLGIDVDTLANYNKMPEYNTELGRNKDGEIVALGYQNTSGAFIYRRSLAIDTWGTDNPDFVAEKIKDWDSYRDSAAELKAKGYYISSGISDLWLSYSFGSDKGWTDGENLFIDPAREGFLDFTKTLIDKDYIHNTMQWTEDWFDDIQGVGPSPVFGYFGPAWLINYTLTDNCGGDEIGEGTFGDWAVCAPTEEFFWGGSWIAASKNTVINASDEKREAIADFIEWVTLDYSDTGLQYEWANGTFAESYIYKQDAVQSSVVMSKSDGTLDFLGGQNMFDIYGNIGSGDPSLYSDAEYYISNNWLYYVGEYANGRYSREDALKYFIAEVTEEYNLDYEEP